MEQWEREIFRSDIGDQIKVHYKKLLSVGKSDEYAEEMIICYFQRETEPGTVKEGWLWLALGLRQWQLGRLSDRVREKALSWCVCTEMPLSDTTRAAYLAALQGKQPERQRIPKPKTSHCPWQVGDLLAYKIMNSDTHVNAYAGKYVLLRIIKLMRWPVTYLAPDDAYSESMLVGLYNWMGDSVPDASTADALDFTPISIGPPILPSFEIFQKVPGHELLTDDMIQQIKKHQKPRIETCCALDWENRTIRRERYTLLGHDDFFQQAVPEFFDTDLTSISLCGVIAFDLALEKRFKQLENIEKNKLS